ncbi:hypothetical protein K438DRAFT_1765599 [Mycena galopus ATCC 62051]|nr:hypothetical protein K438DRAFT_1765599 [Mycena galopus ATCC 62051]
MSFHRVFEKIAEEMKSEAHVESGDCSTVSARNIHNSHHFFHSLSTIMQSYLAHAYSPFPAQLHEIYTAQNTFERLAPKGSWGSYQPQPMQKLLALISAVDSNLLDNIFVVTRAGNSIVFMKEYTALDFHATWQAMFDLVHHLLAQQAAREAAFHAFRHSLQGWQGRFLGAVHFTCDGWDVDSDELPDLVDWDA